MELFFFLAMKNISELGLLLRTYFKQSASAQPSLKIFIFFPYKITN